jgi:predicted Zn-dependent peptidase
MRTVSVLAALLAAALLALPLRAGDDFAAGAARAKEKVLSNGLRVIVFERRQAPVVAFATAVKVGSVDEPRGLTGTAHVFEHMAFKGSTTLGTKDYEAEKKLLDQMEDVFAELKKAKARGASLEEQKKLTDQLDALSVQADKLVVSEEYSTILQRHGGVGLNAWTAADCTVYHVELPSNRLELWMALEADRFAKPVLREFYKEKEAVKEERRLRTDSSPQGKLFEEFTALAFKAHPYGQPTIGHVSDLDALSAREASEFFKRYYTPNNTTISLVGDVSPDEAFAMAEKYFGSLPRGPEPPQVHTVEPPFDGEKRVMVEAKAQPVVGIGWHRPSSLDKDNAVYSAITDLLTGGRSSRLYKVLVVEKKLAVTVEAFTGYPGERFPQLVAILCVPAPGKTTDECVKAIDEELAKLKKDLVDEQELESVKVRTRAGVVRGLRSLVGMAQALSVSQATLGDWREVFAQPDRIAKVTREDVKRVATTLFTRKGRIRGEIVPPPAAEGEAKKDEPKKDEPKGEEKKNDEDGE